MCQQPAGQVSSVTEKMSSLSWEAAEYKLPGHNNTLAAHFFVHKLDAAQDF